MEVEGFSDISALFGPGVYALVRCGEVVYVGKARALYRRIYAHRYLLERKRRGDPVSAGRAGYVKVVDFSGAFIRPCAVSDLDRVEREMIARFMPRHNEKCKPQAKVTLAQMGFDITALIAGIGKPARSEFRRRVL